MRLCQICWKNLKKDPANWIGIPYKKEYLICKKCLERNDIQELINKKNWQVILDTPNLEDILNESNNV